MQPEYFGLVMDPFERGPDPRFLYMDPARRNAFAHLLASVYECKGMVLLACPRGLGKSTLIRHLADQLAALDSVLVLYPGGVLSCRPGMSFADVLAACRGRFDRRQPAASDEERLAATLDRAANRSQVAVLLLDDADALDDAALLRLRELTEADGEDRRLMSVILVGSQKLQQRLEQLAQGRGVARGGRRDGFVDLATDLPSLNDRDVDRLIRHRLTVAGHAEGDLFSPVALAEVARRSHGNPLHVVALCGAAMALAEREAKSTVSRDLVERAAGHVEDLDLDEAYGQDAFGRNERGASPAPTAAAAAAAAAAVPIADAFAAQPVPSARAHQGDAARRLDDVAEAIRAADLRSGGSVDPQVKADPHIKYGPAFARPATGPADQPEPEPTFHSVAAERPSVEFAPAANDHRFYAGTRPSETHRERRRGWLATMLMLVVAAAVLVAAAVYAARSGMIDIAALPDRVGAVSMKLVRLVSNAINANPPAGEGGGGDATEAGSGTGVAEADASPTGSVGGSHSTSLSFDRFGANRDTGAGAEEEKSVASEEVYQFNPPPPQAPTQAPAERQGNSVNADPGRDRMTGAEAARTASEPAPPPVSAPPPLSSSAAKPATQAATPGNVAQQAATPGNVAQQAATPGNVAPQAATPGNGAPQAAAVADEAGNANVLDPGTAVVLSRRGPPETPKPTPPPAPAQAAPVKAPTTAAPAQAGEQATASTADAAHNARSDKNQAQFEPLLARGDEYLVTADLDMARTFYQMAYERGSAEAAVRMGWTFDPQFYKRAGINGEASPREAILWYQEALRRGDRQASQRLSALATWLQSAAASGDVEAKRILKLWQG
ncbi:MAG: AAA family ATPase [Rhodospirillales bacterium]|nr:AAA family ATPase [Rhodospirillales bacterium]